MHVNTCHAAGFAALLEHFGVPETRGDMIEMFGPYICKDAGGYWSYNPTTQFWTQHEECWPNRLPIEYLEKEDEAAYHTSTEYLAELARPENPVNCSKVQREEPFLFMGFKYQWIYIPELKRWEMLSLGR